MSVAQRQPIQLAGAIGTYPNNATTFLKAIGINGLSHASDRVGELRSIAYQPVAHPYQH